MGHEFHVLSTCSQAPLYHGFEVGQTTAAQAEHAKRRLE